MSVMPGMQDQRATSTPFNTQQPNYLSQQFPYGTPTTTPATVGNVPTINAPQLFGQPQAQAPPQESQPFSGGAVATGAAQPGQPMVSGLTYQQYVQQMMAAGMTQQYADQSWQNSLALNGGGQAAPQAPAQGPAAPGGGVPQVGIPQGVTPQQITPQQVMAPGSIVGQMGGPQAYSPNASVSAISNFLQPQFQQQDHALQEALASSGIVGGTTGKAMADLGSQQQTTLMNDIQPYILQRQQMQQAGTTQDVANTMQTGFQNQNVNLQGQSLNQSADMQAQIQNAANKLQAQGMNADMAYKVASQNASLNQQGQLANQGAALQAGEFNASNLNAANQFDISNLLKSGQMDSQTYNQFLQYVMGLQNQDWLAQMNTTANVATAGMGTTTSAFQPNYQQPSPVNLGGIAGAFAPQSNVAAPTPPPISQGFNGGGFPA